VGELRVGLIISLPLTPIVPRTLNDYRHRYPEVTLQLRDKTSLLQMRAILNHELDAGFTRLPEEGVPEGLEVLELQRDPLCAVIHESHPLARERSLSLAQLRDEPFILYPQDAGSGIQRQILHLCQEHGFEPQVEQEAREATTHIGLVSARFGIAILPATVSCIQVEGVRYIPLSDPGAATTLILASRKDDPSPLVRNFIDCVASAKR
jgi:DNA-binding transcriptional LysR family regulator